MPALLVTLRFLHGPRTTRVQPAKTQPTTLVSQGTFSIFHSPRPPGTPSDAADALAHPPRPDGRRRRGRVAGCSSAAWPPPRAPVRRGRRCADAGSSAGNRRLAVAGTAARRSAPAGRRSCRRFAAARSSRFARRPPESASRRSRPSMMIRSSCVQAAFPDAVDDDARFRCSVKWLAFGLVQPRSPPIPSRPQPQCAQTRIYYGQLRCAGIRLPQARLRSLGALQLPCSHTTCVSSGAAFSCPSSPRRCPLRMAAKRVPRGRAVLRRGVYRAAATRSSRKSRELRAHK